MKATFVPEWPGSSIGSVGLSVVAATVTVISRREMMDGDQGVGEAEEVEGGGEEPTGLGEEVRTIYIPQTNQQQVEELVL